MTAKEKLKSLQQMENRIESLKYMAESYRSVAKGLRSPRYSDMPKSTTRQLEPMADALTKAMDLDDEVKELEYQLAIQKRELMDMLLKLDKDSQVVLVKRYFENQSFRQIAGSMYYTERWVYKLHGKAIQMMDEMLKSSV